MSATSVTLRGRRAAERLMVDAVVVKRRTSSTPIGDSGDTTPAYTTLYTGACKIQAASADGSPETVGEAELMVSQLVLHLPMSVTGVTAEDTATVTASALDPDLVGRSFTIRAPMHKSYATARRYPLQELSS